MALVSKLLEKLKPPTWTDDNYTDKRYAKILLSEYSLEYNEVRQEFNQIFSDKVISIHRIQHPFAFCRYKLRQQQILRSLGCTPKEMREFFPLSDDDNLEDSLEYNCDPRRDSCFDFPAKTVTSSKYVIVRKKRNLADNQDSDHYPEYLIECGTFNFVDLAEGISEMIVAFKSNYELFTKKE